MAGLDLANLQTGSAAASFWIFYIGYYALMLGLAAVMALGQGPSMGGDLGGSAEVGFGWSFKWVLVLLLGMLSGLPPFFFFGCKAALLSSLFNLGGGVFIACLALLFLGWYVYFMAVARLLSAPIVIYSSPSQRRVSPARAILLCLVVGGLLYLSFNFLDLIFLSLWVSA